ncbi:hypothetical protein BSKO_09861 [Bryopsis sp. KO-2023]|nr:hypothetical protein BSKO_09861 [Bryopsis sp. KO-2023]
MEESLKTSNGADTDVPQYLGGLAEACAKAPRFGRNGRALVLETARKLADEDDFVFPKIEGRNLEPSPSATAKSASLANKHQPLEAKVEKIRNFDDLFEAIPVRERPMIEYNPRMTKVPRIIRQEAMQTLSGKFLAVILESLGVAPSNAVEAVSKEGELRKVAMAVALVQEQKIYSKSASKLSYSAEAARFEAMESHVPSDCMKELLVSLKTIPGVKVGKKRKSEETAMGDGTEALRKKRVGNRSSDLDDADGIPMRACFGTSSDESESDNEQIQHQEGSAEGSQLEEDKSDIEQVCPSTNIGLPWENCERWLSEAEKQLEDHTERAEPWNRYKRPAKKQSNAVQKSRQKQLPHAPEPKLNKNGDEAGGVFSISGKDWSKSQCKDEDTSASGQKEMVQSQLDIFIRAELDPLLRAHVLTKEVHDMVLKKTLDKVMSCHEDETNADFLIKEGTKIRKLIQQYIGYFRLKAV